MPINMPHTGGLDSLGMIFGTVERPASYTVLFYAADAGAEITFDDEDGYNDPVALLDLNDHSYCIDYLTGVTFSTSVLQSMITTVNGVPQLEFPNIEVAFLGSLSSGKALYGFAVCSATTVIFRELFETPFTPGTDIGPLKFAPIIRIGNSKYNLT